MSRARVRGRASVSLTAQVVEAFGGVCYWCACPATTKDHYPDPHISGGRDTMDNLVAACLPCNSARRDRPGPPRPCPACGVAKHRPAATATRQGW